MLRTSTLLFLPISSISLTGFNFGLIVSDPFSFPFDSNFLRALGCGAGFFFPQEFGLSSGGVAGFGGARFLYTLGLSAGDSSDSNLF